MKGIVFILVPALLAMAVSCRREQGEQQRRTVAQDPLDWLAGTWTRLAADSSLYGESWTRQSDSLFAGYGFREKHGSRTITESLTLVVRKDGGTYSARVRDQNANRVIRFRLTARKADGFTCENPDHDFPTRIEYRHRGTWPRDSLVAVVSGHGEGNIKHEITFAFGRRNR